MQYLSKAVSVYHDKSDGTVGLPKASGTPSAGKPLMYGTVPCFGAVEQMPIIHRPAQVAAKPVGRRSPGPHAAPGGTAPTAQHSTHTIKAKARAICSNTPEYTKELHRKGWESRLKVNTPLMCRAFEHTEHTPSKRPKR